MKYYIFFDIDGTLISKNKVPDSTISTLKKLKENGHFVAIATSRPYVLTYQQAYDLDIDNFVCDGGDGMVVNREIIEILPLNYKDCYDLANEAKNANIAIATSIDTTNNRYSTDGIFIKHNKHLENAFDFVTKEDFKLEDYNTIHKMCLDVTLDKEHLLPSLNKIPHYRISDTCILVEAIDKYKGIEKMVTTLNGDLNNVIVFGDGLNDIKMFEQAPISVAMGNAVDKLKEIATMVTDHIFEDGIEKACKKLNLI